MQPCTAKHTHGDRSCAKPATAIMQPQLHAGVLSNSPLRVPQTSNTANASACASHMSSTLQCTCAPLNNFTLHHVPALPQLDHGAQPQLAANFHSWHQQTQCHGAPWQSTPLRCSCTVPSGVTTTLRSPVTGLKQHSQEPTQTHYICRSAAAHPVKMTRPG